MCIVVYPLEGTNDTKTYVRKRDEGEEGVKGVVEGTLV